MHGTGRALDVMIPTISGDADNTVGDEVGNWLITHAELIGVQYVNWDHRSWNASRSGEKPGRADRTFGSAVSSFEGTMVLANAPRRGHDPVAANA